jgi:hypothetical protein
MDRRPSLEGAAMILGSIPHRAAYVLALSAFVLSCDSGSPATPDAGSTPDAPVADLPAADAAPVTDLRSPDSGGAPDASSPDVPAVEEAVDVARADLFVPECTSDESRACGNCGQQTRSCAAGRWSAWGECGGVGPCAPGATQACVGGGSQTCSSSCAWSACPACASNVCREQGHSSGDHCDGTARVTCGATAEGCSVETGRMACPYGCLDGACLACGDARQACCAGSVCHTPGTLVCSAGSCAHCGASGEPCCDAGAPCGGALACTAGYCQPDMNALWSEDFEAITWDHDGGGTLSDGITLFDAGGPTLRTAIAPGNGSARALGWYGGGVVAPRTVAGMTIPAVFGTTRTLTVEFDAFASIDFDPIIILTSSSCGTTYNVTVRRMYGWQTLSRDFPACSSMGRIVFQVGDIYEAPRSAVALRIDNIHLTYH